MVFLTLAVPPLLACAAAVAAFLWVLAKGSLPALISVVVSTSAALASWLSVAWLLRDGMGPDAVTSSGMDALHRVVPSTIIPLVVWAVVNGLSVRRYRSRPVHAA